MFLKNFFVVSMILAFDECVFSQTGGTGTIGGGGFDDPCDPFPCGTDKFTDHICSPLTDGDGFSCICSEGGSYYDQTVNEPCEEIIDICTDHLCGEFGDCGRIEGGFICECEPSGYYVGVYEICPNPDPCDPFPCSTDQFTDHICSPVDPDYPPDGFSCICSNGEAFYDETVNEPCPSS